jgi:hypothetical protein
MKSLLKIMVVASGIAVVSASVVVVVKQPRLPHSQVGPAGDPLPTAISNYSKTFKLNTNQPIWTVPANGRSTTN